ncbi:hypothetical protein GQX74_011263 [Glossina fuscipes]|nr:hypothetical protein GQX74_011263 [Glossina fuscipes]
MVTHVVSGLMAHNKERYRTPGIENLNSGSLQLFLTTNDDMFNDYGPMVCWENMTMSPGIIHNEYGNGDSLQSLLQERSLVESELKLLLLHVTEGLIYELMTNDDYGHY